MTTVEMPNTIYHYCSAESAMAILTTKTMWLSSTTNLNDYSEVSWGNTKIYEKLLKLEGKLSNEDYKYLLELFTLNSPNAFFISSLSEEGDLLSQWRAYANDATGIAIGFDYNKLISGGSDRIAPNNMRKLGVCKIEYNESTQDQRIDNGIKSLLTYDLVPEALKLIALTPQFKNPAFSEEKEYRLVYSPLMITNPEGGFLMPARFKETTISELKHRVVQNNIVSYFEHSFPMDAVKNIVLGPKNTFSQFDLDSFLSVNGYKDIGVLHSKATYR